MYKLILDTIQHLYKTPIAPNHWTDSMDLLSSATGAKGSAFVTLDALERPEYGLAESNSLFSLEFREHYQKNYGHYELPGFSKVMASDPFKIIKDTDIWGNLDSLRQRPDSIHLRETLGIDRRVGAKISTSPAYITFFTLQYALDRGSISIEEKKHLDLLLPHVSQAVDLSRTFKKMEIERDALTRALDRLQFGLVVFSQSGHPIFANKAAHTIIEDHDAIRMTQDQMLVPTSPEMKDILISTLKQNVDVSLGQSNNQSTTLGLPRKSGKTPLICEVYPLHDVEDKIDRKHVGSVMFLIDPDDQTIVDPTGLSSVCKLTEAETAVVSLIVEGMSNTEIAETRSVSSETIKSQIRSILTKTSSRSRSEIVRLALRVNIPVSN